MAGFSRLTAAVATCSSILLASGCLAATSGPSTDTADDVSAAIDHARNAALQRWQPDAQLAQVQIVGMTQPRLALQAVVMFFTAPSTRDVLDVSQQFDITPEGSAYVQRNQPNFAQVMGKMMWMVEPHPPNAPPFPLKFPIPDEIVSPMQVITSVIDGCAACTAAFPTFTAELHTYQNGAGQVPVWAVQFGTNERFISATTGKPITNCTFPREQNRFRLRMICQ